MPESARKKRRKDTIKTGEIKILKERDIKEFIGEVWRRGKIKLEWDDKRGI